MAERALGFGIRKTWPLQTAGEANAGFRGESAAAGWPRVPRSPWLGFRGRDCGPAARNACPRPPFTCRRTYAGICNHGTSTEGPLGPGSASWAQIWLFRTHSRASSGQCPSVLTCQMGVMIGPVAQACCMDQTRPHLRGGLSGAWHTDSARKQKLLFLLGAGS